jgi:hypothetical protein
MGKILAYHFVGPTLRDGRPVPSVGVWLEHDGPVIPCQSGLHASLDVWDALKFAPGNTLCVVELGGTIKYDRDKVVASRRKIVAQIDAEPLLREFSRRCAQSVLHLWDAPQVVKDYLATGDESLRSAAWNAAWVARCAARAATEAAWAARCAARVATDAARAATDAAWAARWAARSTRDALDEWEQQASMFRSMVRAAFLEVDHEAP